MVEHRFISGENGSREDLQGEVTQLRSEAEDRKRQVEELKMVLEKKRTEVEDGLRECREKQRELGELKADLKAKTEEIQEKDRELEKTRAELEELNSLAEEKSREADECMDKYCNLMVKVHKLEETNDSLKTQLEQMSANQRATEASSSDNRRRSARKSSSRHQEENRNTENVAPSTPQATLSGKRGHCDINDKESAQEALHNLTKKIKANAVTTPKPRNDEDEFRPEGLPELVQKGGCGFQVWTKPMFMWVCIKSKKQKRKKNVKEVSSSQFSSVTSFQIHNFSFPGFPLKQTFYFTVICITTQWKF